MDVRVGVGVTSIDGDGHVERVRLADGTAVECDVLLVAIGVVPETRWLDGSGLTVDDGVVCDATCAAGPGIVAAGDVCRWPNALFGGATMRVEHWTNAAEQGAYAGARVLAGLDEGGGAGTRDSTRPSDGRAPIEPFAPVPFVWSDQYDAKIQSVGVYGGGDRMEIVHGTLAERRFVALFERHGRLTGALAFDNARRLIGYRRMIGDRAAFDDALEAARSS